MVERARPRIGRLSIGGLSRRTGCKVETIRYYERIGLMPSPPRTEGGHRLYGTDAVKRLTFIRRARELGFPLERIRGLLDLVDSRSYSCVEVGEITRMHLEDVRRRIEDLKRLEHVLAETVAKCAGGETPECPVIDALFREAA